MSCSSHHPRNRSLHITQRDRSIGDPAKEAPAREGERPGAEPHAHAERGAGQTALRPAHVPGGHEADEDRDAEVRAQLHLGAESGDGRRSAGAAPGRRHCERRQRHRQHRQRRSQQGLYSHPSTIYN